MDKIREQYLAQKAEQEERKQRYSSPQVPHRQGDEEGGSSPPRWVAGCLPSASRSTALSPPQLKPLPHTREDPRAIPPGPTQTFASPPCLHLPGPAHTG